MERDYNMTELQEEMLNFNSHAHVERDGVESPVVVAFVNFNSHAHVERDT